MNQRLLRTILFGLVFCFSTSAKAWFFFWIPLPGQKDVDPDSIVLSGPDRELGKCAGYHVNQAAKGMNASYGDRYPGAAPAEPQQTPESKFHSDMADLALSKASDRDNVKGVAQAYSVKWGRSYTVDKQFSRQYGSGLVQACISNDIPYRFSDYAAWQARQEQRKRDELEAERKRIEEDDNRKRAQAEESKRASPVSPTSSNAETAHAQGSIDYVAEAKKSARILGCNTDTVQLAGADQGNVVFLAHCENGQELSLSCDRSGLCLKK